LNGSEEQVLAGGVSLTLCWNTKIKQFLVKGIKIISRMATVDEKEMELIRQFKLYMSDPENVILAAKP
jgi:hypothetical protein